MDNHRGYGRHLAHAGGGGAMKAILRRDIIAMCVAIFFADVMWSIIAPTFSLYATQLGASLDMVGILSSVSGLAQFIFAVPIGMMSDKLGRKSVIAFGFGLFAAAMMVLVMAQSALALGVARVLFGLATIATFTIGAAYIGDVIQPHERGAAFGLYATSMGAGAAVGPLVTALAQPLGGIVGGYMAGAGIGVIGLFITLIGLAGRPRARAEMPQHVGPAPGRMIDVLKNPNLLAASLGLMLANTSYVGAIISFFPLQAAAQGLTLTAIATLFSARSFASALARLPAGLISGRFSRWAFVLGSLVMIVLALVGISVVRDPSVLAGILILEGVAYGAYLSVGQAFVAEHSTDANRGTATGTYSAAGSLGSTVSPFVLGAIAGQMGLAAVFGVMAVVALVLLFVIFLLYWRSRRAA
ncbi:MAG TPA: MFS transporter, partial [Thermoflexales bacterium]|nr:MFS transporter [Thermoflexales bacterium]